MSRSSPRRRRGLLFFCCMQSGTFTIRRTAVVAVGGKYLKAILANLAKFRKKAGMTESDLEKKLILGPGWIERIESGRTVPSLDLLLAIIDKTGTTLSDLIKDLPKPDSAEIDRFVSASQSENDLLIKFRYADYDAQYLLPNSRVEDFEKVINVLRDGLSLASRAADADRSEAIKTEAVATSFILATKLWPKANPSDLWWFIIYRAYCDPYNHPAEFARLDFSQSWKRTGGWALEEILVRHYGPYLKKNGVNLFIADANQKKELVKQIKLKERVEVDKIDF